MDLSKIKLVATDMDGTLLNSNHEVSQRFFNVFKNLKKHNIIFAAASGRPYYSILEKLHPIKDDIIFVAENGGLIVKNNKVLLTTHINKTNMCKIIDGLNKLKRIDVVFCTQNKAYIKSLDLDLIKLITEFYPKNSIINSIDEIKEDIIKIALYHKESSETYLYPYFKDLDNNFDVKVSGKNWLDISQNIANKGYAINKLQKDYNISQDETLTFGDYNNDLSMLQQSKYSFAMENAHQNAKDTANYGTKSNDDFGVEIILEKVIEAKGKI
ncbi:HAD family hydrolase [Algibacter sp. PT7-4]|uniref:HAD family hydrolase n=1 Tax=Algibacter ulvanivorans TaxID=3400999 RepID=UPI003AAEB14B